MPPKLVAALVALRRIRRVGAVGIQVGVTYDTVTFASGVRDRRQLFGVRYISESQYALALS